VLTVPALESLSRGPPTSAAVDVGACSGREASIRPKIWAMIVSGTPPSCKLLMRSVCWPESRGVGVRALEEGLAEPELPSASGCLSSAGSGSEGRGLAAPLGGSAGIGLGVVSLESRRWRASAVVMCCCAVRRSANEERSGMSMCCELHSSFLALSREPAH